MNIKALILAILYVLVLSSQLPLSAKPLDDWQKLILEGSTQKFDGQYNIALQIYTKALAIADSNKLPPKCLPISLCRLAGVEVITNRITEADSHFYRIIDLIKQQREAGTLDPQVTFWAAALSDEYLDNMLPKNREICLRRACYLKDLIYSDAHKECIGCLNKLADYYIAQGKVDKAIHFLTLVDRVMEKKYGKDPLRLAATLHQLAIKCRFEHRFTQSKQLELVVIEIAKSHLDLLGSEIPYLYCFLGMNALTQSKIDESKEFFHVALQECPRAKIMRKKLSKRHPITDPEMCTKLLYLDYKENTPAQEEIGLKQQIAVGEALSENPRCYYGCVNLLGNILANEDKTEEFEKCTLHAISIAKLPDSFEKDVPDLYLDLGIYRGKKGKATAAYEAFSNAFKAERDKNGYHAALVLFWWGYFLREHHQFQIAADKLNIALKQMRKLAPEKRGTLLADILEVLAVIQYELNRPELAQPLKQQSFDEIQLQKKIKTKIGPDFFHRM